MSQIKVLELFAGVGGFRLGLEGDNRGFSATSKYRDALENKIPFEIIYSNQWEPSTKAQHAADVYTDYFGERGFFNCNIDDLKIRDLQIPCDLLTAGFPCPDFSVASLRKNSKGLDGKKGMLWYSIVDLIKKLKAVKRQPTYLFFENVDRMLKSPHLSPGRDFRLILDSLHKMNYNLEWKVINAAEYGFPQRRRRVFIFCYHKKSEINNIMQNFSPDEIINSKGVISRAFPSSNKSFSSYDSESKFHDSGVMVNNKIHHANTKTEYAGNRMNIRSILYRGRIPDDYFVPQEQITKWKIEKGAKRKQKFDKSGFSYIWSEGKIDFPDLIDKPSRTIITSEGGKSVSRIRHVIEHKKKLRRLLPIEIERLNMFPDNITDIKNIKDTRRVYLMGNALVVGIVEKIGHSLSELLSL